MRLDTDPPNKVQNANLIFVRPRIISIDGEEESQLDAKMMV